MRVPVSNDDNVKKALFERLCVSLRSRSVELFDCRMTGSGFSGKLRFRNTRTEFNFDIFDSELTFSVGDNGYDIYMSDGKSIPGAEYDSIVDFVVRIVNEKENSSVEQSSATVAAGILPSSEQSSAVNVTGTLPSNAGQSWFAMMLVRLLNIVQGKEKLDNETLELIKDVVDFLNQRK